MKHLVNVIAGVAVGVGMNGRPLWAIGLVAAVVGTCIASARISEQRSAA